MKLILLSQNDCAPCKELKLFLKNEDVEFTEYNLSNTEHSHLIEEYSVMSTPVTILIDEDGEELVRVAGAKEKDKDAILDLADEL